MVVQETRERTQTRSKGRAVEGPTVRNKMIQHNEGNYYDFSRFGFSTLKNALCLQLDLALHYATQMFFFKPLLTNLSFSLSCLSCFAGLRPASKYDTWGC